MSIKNLVPHDIGDCGSVQMMYAGSIAFDTEDASTGVELCTLPANIIVTKAVAVVGTAFNAGTTNVLTVGTNDDVNNLLGSSDVTEGTAGDYSKNTFLHLAAKTKVKAKFTQTGTAATAGAADIYLEVVRCPA